MLHLKLNNQPRLRLHFFDDNSFSNDLYDADLGLAEYVERDTSSPNATGVSSATGHSYADPECVQSLPGSNLAPPAMLQFAKTRKLSIERSDPRKYVC